MKTINISRVLRLLWQKKGITRIDIASELRLDKSTITKIMNLLLAKKVVQELEEGQAGPQGGRKPIHLTINKNFGCVAGFEVQPNYWKFVVVNLEGEIVLAHRNEISITADNLISVMSDALEFLRDRMKILQKKLIGVGIGASGILNPLHGTITQSIPFQITSPMDILSPLSPKAIAPLYLDNDANCCAWGELAFHKSAHLANFIFILLEIREKEILQKNSGGIAVGLGMVLAGKVHYGNNFSAGEFRSVFSNKNDVNQFSLSRDELLAINTDKNIFARFADEIGENIALLVNVLNVSHVFLSITNVNFKDQLIPVIEQKIREKSPYPEMPECTVHYSSFEDNAVAYGAAGMILEHMFAHPEIPKPAEIRDDNSENDIHSLDSLARMLDL